jgi:hypothetical protein
MVCVVAPVLQSHEVAAPASIVTHLVGQMAAVGGLMGADGVLIVTKVVAVLVAPVKLLEIVTV